MMKQLTIKSKIIFFVIILTIIAGIAVVVLKGFNFELKNQNANMMEIYLNKRFLLSNIEEIAKETLETNNFIIQKVELYEEGFTITAKEITEEQKSNFIKKINEMYGVELKDEDIKIENIPHIHFRDIIKPYILPIGIATTSILVYIALRYMKLGILKSILKTGVTLVIAQFLLFSVMAISRFPIGRYTFPLLLFVYFIATLGITINLEKNLRLKQLDEEK